MRIYFLLAGFFLSMQSFGQVWITGAMRNVMWKGELHGIISTDTLSGREGVYGMGPLAFLKGEIILLNGRLFTSVVVDEKNMKVEEVSGVSAPFFAHAMIHDWEVRRLPATVQSQKDLEHYLDSISSGRKEPFMFRLKGKIRLADIHVVNLPEGASVSSPDEAHQGQVNYKILDEEAEVLGFFSRNHQSIFTHHDSFLHMHLITHDQKKMGHVDAMIFGEKEVLIYLPPGK